MSYNTPNHFGYNLELKLDKIPAKVSDRIALSLLFPGLLVGLFLILLGCYELFHGVEPQSDTVVAEKISPWFNLTFFDSVIIALGLWIICSLIVSYFTYKKVFFDGKKITMVYRKFFGKKFTVKESIKKFKGVRFRVEFFQFGLVNKNKYIIELYHDESDKITPLYISTSGHNIRKIWKNYALALKLPEIIMTDEGWASRNLENIGESLIDIAQKGGLKSKFNAKEAVPHSVSLVKKKDKLVLKNRTVRWDVFNIITAVGACIALLILAFNAQSILRSTISLCLSCILLVFILFILLKILTKDKLVIKPDKIVIVHKTLCFSRKKYDVLKKNIEAVDIAFNPSSERYFLAIIGDDKTFVFGKKLPLDDLRWVRKFLIHHIIKK